MTITTPEGFTAGPWIASPPAENAWPDRPCVADVDGGPSIYGAKGASEGDRDADARLIAAAPELYEALKQMVEERVDYMRINNLGDPEAKRIIKIARAALAKAQAAAR